MLTWSLSKENARRMWNKRQYCTKNAFLLILLYLNNQNSENNNSRSWKKYLKFFSIIELLLFTNWAANTISLVKVSRRFEWKTILKLLNTKFTITCRKITLKGFRYFIKLFLKIYHFYYFFLRRRRWWWTINNKLIMFEHFSAFISYN